MQPNYQPYGQAQMAAPMPMARRSYKAFGITYMCIRGILLLIVMLALLVLGGVILGLDQPGTSSAGSEVATVMGVVILFVVLWLAYVIAAGVMAIKGMIAGVYMGLVDAGLNTVLVLAQLGMGGGDAVGGSICGLILNVAIIILAVLALKQRYGAPAPSYGPQPYSMQPQYGRPQLAGQYGAPAQYGAAPQQGYGVAPQAGYGQQAVPRPHVDATSAVVPSPKMAALSILALAASVDPDISNEALGRARTVAAKLLGPAAQARIQRQLAQPVNVMDVDADLMQHTMILNQQSNEAMKTNVIKAAEYVLKGPNGVEGLGEQFMATLKQQLGM